MQVHGQRHGSRNAHPFFAIFSSSPDRPLTDVDENLGTPGLRSAVATASEE